MDEGTQILVGIIVIILLFLIAVGFSIYIVMVEGHHGGGR